MFCGFSIEKSVLIFVSFFRMREHSRHKTNSYVYVTSRICGNVTTSVYPTLELKRPVADPNILKAGEAKDN